MAPSNTNLATDVLDMAEKLDGFAQRLIELRTDKKPLQTELGRLAELHYGQIGLTSDYLLDGP